MSNRNLPATGITIDDRRIVLIGRLLVPVLLLVVWKLMSVFVSFQLAPPEEAFAILYAGLVEGWMVSDLERTMFELFFAYLLAVVSGLVIGVSLGLNQFWRQVFDPFVFGGYSIPKITLFPIALFLFGLGADSKIAFAWSFGVFPIIAMSMSVTEMIRDEHIKVGKVLNLSRLQTFREIVVPSVLPGLMIGLRLGFNTTFIGVVIGEMFAARAGLGYSLMESMAMVNVPQMLAIVSLLIIIATGVNFVFYALEMKLGARDADTDMRMM